MRIFTIGFTRKSAERFFGLLRDARVETLVDVRLNNVSQLAGFAKRDDLRFFLRHLAAINYVHRLDLAPTQDMLTSYKKQGATSWAQYAGEFLELIESRHIEDAVSPSLLNNAVLLCSEDKPHHCHRRLVAEYLADRWGGVEIVHLV